MATLNYCSSCKDMVEMRKNKCPNCGGACDRSMSTNSFIWGKMTKAEKDSFIGSKGKTLPAFASPASSSNERTEADNKHKIDLALLNKVIVTTGDLKADYDIIGPVYFQVSNKGLLGSTLDTLKLHYGIEIQKMKMQGTMSMNRSDWGFLYGEWSVDQNDFESAFYIATQELKKRACIVGADAVICMRQDIDMDPNSFGYFYLQMYRTAVKLK